MPSKIVATLLKRLDTMYKEDGDQSTLTIFTPAQRAFLDANDQVNERLVNSVNDFKSLANEKQQILDDISAFRVTGARGAFSDMLKAFATSGTWNVYSQQYLKRKIPFILNRDILEAKVFVKTIVDKLDDSALQIKYIRAFQYYLVDIETRYEDEHVDGYDFDEVWGKLSISWSRLKVEPLKYDELWQYFFKNPDKKTSIDKLIGNIIEALTYHDQMMQVKNSFESTSTFTNKVVERYDEMKSEINGLMHRDSALNSIVNDAQSSGSEVSSDMHDAIKKTEDEVNDKVKIDDIVKEDVSPIKTRTMREFKDMFRKYLDMVDDDNVVETISEDKRNFFPCKFSAMCASKKRTLASIKSDDMFEKIGDVLGNVLDDALTSPNKRTKNDDKIVV